MFQSINEPSLPPHTHSSHTHTHTHITQEEYLSAASQGSWNRRIELSGGEVVIIHSPSAIIQYPASQFRPIDHQEEYSQPRSVLRGFLEVNKVEQGERQIFM